MTKEFFVRTEALPDGKERILGVCSACVESGIQLRIFSLREREAFIQGLVNICNDALTAQEKVERVEALFLEFL